MPVADDPVAPRRMPSLKTSLRSLRRAVRARLGIVKREDFESLQQSYQRVSDGWGWDARPADAARLHAVKAVPPRLHGEVCLFVGFARRAGVEPDVAHHLRQLLRAGLQVVLLLNSDHAAAAHRWDDDLLGSLSGIYLRENRGFDFAAWSHLYAACGDTSGWSRLYLVNDSIVGPLRTPDFDRLLARIRASRADVVGLTENALPMRHLQSFFLVLNATALRHAEVQDLLRHMLSLATKQLVIDMYETRLTQRLEMLGLSCVAMFASMSDNPLNSNDTVHRWDRLLADGFPYIKRSVIRDHPEDPRILAQLPVECRPAAVVDSP